MIRILVLTDSLGLPRDTPEVVFYEQTWPNLLKKEGYEVIQASVGGGTIIDLYRQAAYYMVCSPDIVVLQVGIVDCAPRMLTQNENYFFNNFKVTRAVLGVITPHFGNYIRKVRKAYYVKPKLFIYYLNLLLSFFQNSKVYCIGILPICAEYEVKAQGISKRAEAYNKILKNIFKERFISTYGIPFSGIMSDFHHLNPEGHKYVFLKVISMLRNE